MTSAIRTRDLCRRFDGRLVVDHVSLDVPARSVYGFLGRNGAGKTTTLRMLLGLIRPDAGSAWLDGIDVAHPHRLAARRVGALLEAEGFYGNLSGYTNLDLSRRLLGCPASEVNRVLELVEMSAHAHRPVANYSLGMRQRLGVARAMLGAPPVLILDEPTNGLDPEGMADMRRFLRELPERTGATVLVSSHLLGEIEQVASHVGILSHGRLVLQGELARLKATVATEILVQTDRPEHAVAVASAHGFALQQASHGLLARVDAGQDPRSTAAALNRVLNAAGLAVHALAPQAHTLERLYEQASRPAAA